MSYPEDFTLQISRVKKTDGPLKITSNLISNARAIGLDPYTSTTLWVFQVKMCRSLSLSYGTAQSTDLFQSPYMDLLIGLLKGVLVTCSNTVQIITFHY